MNTNLITSIADGALSGLGSLTYAFVMTHYDMTACAFSYLSRRDLSTNQITSIVSGTFIGLGGLSSL